MANTYFQFQQFKIEQEQCAMKVCTDACILGAIVAAKLARNKNQYNNILDIGTGTGLLSIMIAQKNAGRIDAIELDERAYHQAKYNCNQSPWKDQLNVYHADILHWESNLPYDYIISNPPFYENELASVQPQKNLAMHDTGLSFSKLVPSINQHLSSTGKFAVLIPHARGDYFKQLMKENNLFVEEEFEIKHTMKHPFFRSIIIGSKKDSEITTFALTIKDASGNYTNEFYELLKDYYLNKNFKHIII